MNKPLYLSGQQQWVSNICLVAAIIIRCSLWTYSQRNGLGCQNAKTKTCLFFNHTVISLHFWNPALSCTTQEDEQILQQCMAPSFIPLVVSCGCVSHCLVSFIKVKVSSDILVLMQWDYQIYSPLPRDSHTHWACSFKLALYSYSPTFLL